MTTISNELIVCKSEKFLCILVVQDGTTMPVLVTPAYARAVAAKLIKYADEIETEKGSDNE